jgi:peptidoglycan/LPS O-acetylase OafA/YrhL
MSTVRVGLILFAAYHFAIAALMVLAPHTFFTDIGPFGVQNDHYLRDTATFNIAFGVALAIAVERESWRTPILSCVALQFALHALNHLADIGAAHPTWLGPADFISLSLAALVLIWLARESLPPKEARR